MVSIEDYQKLELQHAAQAEALVLIREEVGQFITEVEALLEICPAYQQSVIVMCKRVIRIIDAAKGK